MQIPIFSAILEKENEEKAVSVLKNKNEIHLPSEPTLKHFKDQCVCCERTGQKMNREHIFPKWLLQHTNTRKDMFGWIYGKVPADQATVPLCEECNSKLGTELEGPVRTIFNAIESGEGFNDNDAELLIRWMWKIVGLFYWTICNKHWKYGFITLKEHVLSRIILPRSRISIALSLIEDPNEEYGCAPVGLDAFSFYSNIYAVGVFSKLCIVVFHSSFEKYIDQSIWTVYRLSDHPMVLNPQNKVYPQYGFKTGSSALQYMKLFFGNESQIYKKHEEAAKKARDLTLRRIENDMN